MIVGRSPKSTLVLQKAYISASHFTIQKQGDIAVLTDTSINGTFVNGKKVMLKTPLQNQSEIKIPYDSYFVFMYAENLMPLLEERYKIGYLIPCQNELMIGITSLKARYWGQDHSLKSI